MTILQSTITTVCIVATCSRRSPDLEPSITSEIDYYTHGTVITQNRQWKYLLTPTPSNLAWTHHHQLLFLCSWAAFLSPGSCADVGIEGASHHMLLRMNSERFLSIGLLTTSGWCVELCPEGSIFLLHSLCSSVSVCSRSLLQHTRFSSEMKLVIAGAKWPPPHDQIYSRIWYAFSMLKLTKFPHQYGGGFKFYCTKYYLKRFIPHVYRARPTHGPWPGSKKVRIWPKIE